jgi:phosphoserine aminotransferase
MMGKRIHNFNAGPAALPLPVLEEIRDEFLDYKGSGMSVIELSHRSKWFDDIANEAVERTKRLLKLGEDFHVLFIQGGASLQFCLIPMNLAIQGKPVDYINTGTWSTKAIKEAEIQGKDVRVIASSEDKDFSYIPKDFQVDGDAAYLHFTSNNTIKGTQWGAFPQAGDVPLISDMSSDIMSRSFDASPFGLIYAGAQKNIGPSGTALVIVRRDMLDRVPDGLPTMLRYTTYAEKNSMFNTPSCFVIYTINLVLKWVEETIGGLDKMEQMNKEKAGLHRQIRFLSRDSCEGQPIPHECDLQAPKRGAGSKVCGQSPGIRAGWAQRASFRGWVPGIDLQRHGNERHQGPCGVHDRIRKKGRLRTKSSPLRHGVHRVRHRV